MKAVVGYLLGAVGAALVGAACLLGNHVDQAFAHAQEHIIAGDYGEPFQIYQDAEPYYEYASRVPWIGNGPLNDIRARKAALLYWQRRYTDIVPEQTDPVGNVPADNVDLQFIMANAMFREGVAKATDKRTTLAMLDALSNAYLTVLKNADRHQDAAYNYEYVVKLRRDVDRNRRKSLRPSNPSRDGEKGARPEETIDAEKFKMYVPLEEQERKSNDAGQDPVIRKKG